MKVKGGKFIFDAILNIVSVAAPLVVLQLMIFPLISQNADTEVYGLVIAMYSLLILVGDPFGKSINNMRLIHTYDSDANSNNYNIILVIYSIFAALIMVVGTIYYDKSFNMIGVAVCVLTCIFILIDGYLIAWFRIKLNYVAVLKNALCTAAGFLLGYWIYTLSGLWQFIFLLGYFMSFVYLYRTTPFLKEPLVKDDKFKHIFADTSVLTIALLFLQCVSLADKLLLLPLLGANTLSVYYSATLIGKIITLATGPINSVVLSYLSPKSSLTKSIFWKYIAACTVSCGVLALLVLVVSRPVLNLLYPQFVDEAMRIVPYTTLNISMFVMGGLLTPMVMRYCKISWQILINGISLFIYVLMSILLLRWFGIIGFCFGIFLSHLCRFMMLMIVYLKFYNEQESTS